MERGTTCSCVLCKLQRPTELRSLYRRVYDILDQYKPLAAKRSSSDKIIIIDETGTQEIGMQARTFEKPQLAVVRVAVPLTNPAQKLIDIL